MGKISPSNGSAPSTGVGSLGSRGACPALVSESTCAPPEPDSLWAASLGFALSLGLFGVGLEFFELLLGLLAEVFLGRVAGGG